MKTIIIIGGGSSMASKVRENFEVVSIKNLRGSSPEPIKFEIKDYGLFDNINQSIDLSKSRKSDNQPWSKEFKRRKY